jgi:hypothetical protein
MDTKITFNYESNDLKPLAIEFLKRLGEVASVHLVETRMLSSRCEEITSPKPSDLDILPVINWAIYLLDEKSGVSIECSSRSKELQIQLYRPLLKEHNAKTLAAFVAFQQIVGKATATV